MILKKYLTYYIILFYIGSMNINQSLYYTDNKQSFFNNLINVIVLFKKSTIRLSFHYVLSL